MKTVNSRLVMAGLILSLAATNAWACTATTNNGCGCSGTQCTKISTGAAVTCKINQTTIEMCVDDLGGKGCNCIQTPSPIGGTSRKLSSEADSIEDLELLLQGN